MVIALIGKICSGKDTVASFFPSDEFEVIDGDGITHICLEENKDSLYRAFGDVFKEDGSVDRPKIASIVFSDENEMKKLSDITDPWIVDYIKREADRIESEGKIAVINGALVEKMGLLEISDRVLFVDAPYDVRKERAFKRSGMDEDEFDKRDRSQSEVGKLMLSYPIEYDIICNDSDLSSLYRQVKEYCGRLLKES